MVADRQAVGVVTAPHPDQLWAAIVLCLTPDTCSSVLAGRPVRAGNLDPFFLRRALRGGQLPDAEAFILVVGDLLDAVVEAGPLPETYPDIPERARPRLRVVS
jgi:hypothetical protein